MANQTDNFITGLSQPTHQNLIIMKLLPTLSAILTFIVLTSSHCRKHPINPVLPPETQTGANTFGCKVNGDIWIPNGAPFTIPAFDVQYYKSTGGLLIKTNRSDKGQSLNIYLYGVYQPNQYNIFNPNTNAFVYSNSNSSCNWYDRNNSSQTGIVSVTKIDTTNKIVSGRFNGAILLNGCPDINITDGRFDFKMDIFN